MQNQILAIFINNPKKYFRPTQIKDRLNKTLKDFNKKTKDSNYIRVNLYRLRKKGLIAGKKGKYTLYSRDKAIKYIENKKNSGPKKPLHLQGPPPRAPPNGIMSRPHKPHTKPLNFPRKRVLKIVDKQGLKPGAADPGKQIQIIKPGFNANISLNTFRGQIYFDKDISHENAIKEIEKTFGEPFKNQVLRSELLLENAVSLDDLIGLKIQQGDITVTTDMGSELGKPEIELMGKYEATKEGLEAMIMDRLEISDFQRKTLAQINKLPDNFEALGQVLEMGFKSIQKEISKMAESLRKEIKDQVKTEYEKTYKDDSAYR